MTQPATFLDAVVQALETAGAYNKQDQSAPAAVLWPDKELQWEPLVPRLGERLPIFSLGNYSSDQRTGPAYWLRCIIARSIAHPGLPEGRLPVLYLPGYSRQDVRAVESCPRPLQPLAELQYRGVLWSQKNGRDWTIAAFLQNKDGGQGIEVGTDAATKEALPRSLVKLAEETIEALRAEAPIRAPFLDSLLHPDDVKNVLRWLNDPPGFRSASTAAEWGAFIALCQNRYGFHPEKDGPITAARLLGQRNGGWTRVWRRFAEAPVTYLAIPELLRQARPPKLLPLMEGPEAWPQDNETAEASLRKALAELAKVDEHAARAKIAELENEHWLRRSWVWATLGRAPLAHALEHIASLAKETAQSITGSTVAEVAGAYSERGWAADLAAMKALASVEASEDVGVIRAVLQTIYRPWLEAGATSLQKAINTKGGGAYAATPPPPLPAGSCILFTDGLRYDVAQRLRAMVTERGLECNISPGLAALPTITAIAKPAISPVAGALRGDPSSLLEPVVAVSGTKVTIDVLRRTLAEADIQVLKGDELGEPSGCGWTELGDIDASGHERGWRLPHHLDTELRSLERHIKALLDHGWQRVLVVTDHGWLLLPGGLPKAELPEHLTEIRKGRCARLKEGAKTDYQVVAWHWSPSVRFAVAPGIHCFEAGKDYEHGGVSPQECVVPTLTVVKPGVTLEPVTISAVMWRRLRCNVNVIGAPLGLRIDLRTKAGDPATSLVMGGKELGKDGAAALFVEDDDREGQGAVVVVLGPDGSVRTQIGTIVGGSQ